jgi:hypothetical protein
MIVINDTSQVLAKVRVCSIGIDHDYHYMFKVHATAYVIALTSSFLLSLISGGLIQKRK